MVDKFRVAKKRNIVRKEDGEVAGLISMPTFAADIDNEEENYGHGLLQSLHDRKYINTSQGSSSLLSLSSVAADSRRQKR